MYWRSEEKGCEKSEQNRANEGERSTRKEIRWEEKETEEKIREEKIKKRKEVSRGAKNRKQEV